MFSYPQFSTLTPSETQVLELVAIGLRDREIAPRLGLDEETVRAVAETICFKLGVSGRFALVIETLRLDWKSSEGNALPREKLPRILALDVAFSI